MICLQDRHNIWICNLNSNRSNIRYQNGYLVREYLILELDQEITYIQVNLNISIIQDIVIKIFIFLNPNMLNNLLPYDVFLIILILIYF